MLLLLQSFTGYAEALLSGRAVPAPRGPGPGMSAGLTARTFWSSMLKLGALCQELRDQTPGPPLGSCDSCSSAQASLHEVGRAITSICQSQNIPSALSKFQEVLEDGTGRRNLSAADMSYWASEQSKDLSRINKHLQGLLQQLNPVRAELEQMGKQKDKLQKQVEDFSRKLQAEKSIQAEQQKAAEQSLKAKEKEHSKAVARLEEEKDELRRGTELFPAVPSIPSVLG
ncbi:hypothetical protein EK904_005370 [Melospiza melodia maxima]|nr:hypothetical protein EK904_005370 [Melospiza melodia maxima]